MEARQVVEAGAADHADVDGCYEVRVREWEMDEDDIMSLARDGMVGLAMEKR